MNFLALVSDRQLPKLFGVAHYNTPRPRSVRKLLGAKLLRYRQRSVRTVIIGSNLFVLALIVSVVMFSERPGAPSARLAFANQTDRPVDTVAAAEIAHTVAELTNLPELAAVHNQADSAAAELGVASDGGMVSQKPSVVSSSIKTKADIRSYTTQPGDTVSSLAAQFSVTSDSLRWSNNLFGNAITAGTQLYISPISNGFVYAVEKGDTPDSLATKFRTSKEKIVAFNDAEISGLTPGDHIVIPDGIITLSLPGFGASGTFAWGGNSPIYGSNGYDYGQCTYWAALRRSQTGHAVPSNLGNAITWVQLAQKTGLETGRTPRKGAVLWTPPTMLSAYYAAYGHVGFVEDVLADGTVKVSDMNMQGWNIISYRTLTPEAASAYSYIY